jgi:hypothetical protein
LAPPGLEDGDMVPVESLPYFELVHHPDTNRTIGIANDGVSRSDPPDPTSNLLALAAAGRDPTDITIPVLAGSEGSGEGGDDAVVAGPISGSTAGASSAAQPAASEDGSGTEVASAGNSSSTAGSSTSARTAALGSSGGSSGPSGSSGGSSSSGSGADGTSSSVTYSAAGASSSGATSSSTSPGASSSGSAGQGSGGRVPAGETADEDEPAEGSHLTDEQVFTLSAKGYPMQRIKAADAALAANEPVEVFLLALGHPQPDEGAQAPKAPPLRLNVKTPDEVVMELAATAEPVLRPYMVKGGAIVSFTGHVTGAAIGGALVADPDPTASKAFGVYMVVVNVDGAIAEVRTFSSGQPTPTVLHEAVRQGLVRAGVDERVAERAAALAELTSNPAQAYKVAVMMPGGLIREPATQGPLFGQRRVSPTFGVKGRPPEIAGRSVTDVAADLFDGKISPDALPIAAFIDSNGNLVSANTRSLAALSGAGLKPTIVNIINPTQDLLDRLAETPLIPDAPLPGPNVPMTPSKTDLTIIGVFELPD